MTPRKTKEEARMAEERERDTAARERSQRRLDCRLKCGANSSCMDHCNQYGY
ncbi:hypothetical protein AKJ09_05771 [Labilithrix luteola]|uniref:Uncharacterized protein n=1 Tax=Labilithrix luteola TaxID=1391654 RepID=A0A0K1Q033_9BACT|nr:hypothetical protein AKJ09_05771 [Labilithrix luteola]